MILLCCFSGEINSINLPVWCRKPCYYLYSWMFSCNLAECDIDDLTEFKNLSEFFRRGLKPNARTIDQTSCLISPCDGKILHFGKVERGMLEQVKGVNYALDAFLGEQTWPKSVNVSGSTTPASLSPSASSASHTTPTSPSASSSGDEFAAAASAKKMTAAANTQQQQQAIRDTLASAYQNSLLYDAKNCLYHCVIYLAPGDYHRFHSPADWEIFYRRHFPGELFSVNPSVARWLQGLFNLNERVVYYGKWQYGFFSMAPVGATNVGSIRVYMDQVTTSNYIDIE